MTVSSAESAQNGGTHDAPPSENGVDNAEGETDDARDATALYTTYVEYDAPAQGGRMYRVGIVGHRYLRGPDTPAFVSEQCAAILRSARKAHADIVAVSAFARGADSIFAREAVRLGIPLHGVRPFHSYVHDFPTRRSRREYLSLRRRACRELALPFTHRTREAYVMAMDWIVRNTELLVAVWDGAPAIGPGGTADAVHQRMRVGTPWIRVDVSSSRAGAAR